MSFSGALTVLDTHLVAAGAAISPTITNVAQGERTTSDRRIDYWFTSIGDPSSLGGRRTLTDQMYGVRVFVRVYFPVSGRRETLNANLEADLYAISIDIVGRVKGDATLGANCVDSNWESVETGWQDLGGAWLRVSDITFVLDFVEAIPIAA